MPHARATIIIRAHNARLPFNITMMHAVGGALEEGILTAAAAGQLHAGIGERLARAAEEPHFKDSPLFPLIPSFPGIDLPHAATAAFRDRARTVDATRDQLAAARALDPADGLPRARAIEARPGPIDEVNAELAADLMLAYRDLRAYDEMIALVERISPALSDRTVTLREQYAFALNRRNVGTDRHRAVDVLGEIIAAHGDSPETCPLLARVYKDIFADAKRRGEHARTAGHLSHAITYYRRGFNADWRDYHPGINLATLLAIDGSSAAVEELRSVLLAITFAVGRLGGLTSHNYWTVATVLEVAVLGDDWNTERAQARLIALAHAPWMLETTTRNLTLLRGCEPCAIDLARLDGLILELLHALPPDAVARLRAVLTPEAAARLFA